MKLSSVRGLAKLALEGSDPLDSQSSPSGQNGQGYLSQAHDFMTKRHGMLGGASPLQLGAELVSLMPRVGIMGKPLGPLAAAYSRAMEPGQSWPEGLAQGAVSGLSAAGGKYLGEHSPVAPEVMGALASILGSNMKVGTLKKKANLTQPMGVPVKSEFTHNPMGEPMDMSASSQAGSMGTAAPKKPKKDGKDKKADDDESTAMRSFMGTWSRSKDIHAKSAAYKNFMSRVGKYQSMDY